MGNEVLENLSTIRDYIRWGTSEFTRKKLTFGHGYSCAFDEAVYLTLFALSLPNDWPEAYFDCVLTRAERRRVLTFLYRRAKTQKPAAYLTKQAWFAGLQFYVDERVLVPRSPIAELIEEHFEPWVDSDQVGSILDLCTGSGCIAIACQYAFPEAKVVASDVSADALQVAQINCKTHHLDEDIELIESDVFDSIPAQKFDIIVTNPPYVDAEDMASLPAEFTNEPVLGLEAGRDGLDVVTRILYQAADYLTDDGVLIVEVGNSQPAVMEKFEFIPMTWLEFARGGTGVFKVKMKYLKICRAKIQLLLTQPEEATKEEPENAKLDNAELDNNEAADVNFHAVSGQDISEQLQQKKVDDYQLVPLSETRSGNLGATPFTQAMKMDESAKDEILISPNNSSENSRQKIVNELLAGEDLDETNITFPPSDDHASGFSDDESPTLVTGISDPK